MSGNFSFGAVVMWEKFKFDDGGSSDKLLVILGAKQGHAIIAVMATTKAHGRPKSPGCQAKHDKGDFYFIPGGMKDSFKEDTWIELYRPQEIDAPELIKVALKKEAHVIFNLMANTAAGIRNCLKLCDDTSPHHLSLLE